MLPAQKTRDSQGRVIRGQWNYRGHRIINKFYDGWGIRKINPDGTLSEEEVACTPLLCLAKRAIDRLVG